MNSKNPTKLSLLSDKQRETAIGDIIDFFRRERDEQIGMIAAEDLLDMLLEQVGKELYNKGLDDAKDFLKTRFDEIAADIEISLKKS